MHTNRITRGRKFACTYRCIYNITSFKKIKKTLLKFIFLKTFLPHNFFFIFYFMSIVSASNNSNDYPQTAVAWLKYCPYDVKLYPINQSTINQLSSDTALSFFFFPHNLMSQKPGCSRGCSIHCYLHKR